MKPKFLLHVVRFVACTVQTFSISSLCSRYTRWSRPAPFSSRNYIYPESLNRFSWRYFIHTDVSDKDSHHSDLHRRSEVVSGGDAGLDPSCSTEGVQNSLFGTPGYKIHLNVVGSALLNVFTDEWLCVNVESRLDVVNAEITRSVAQKHVRFSD